MIDGVKKDGNGRKIDEFVSINAFARGSLKDICDELAKSNVKVSVRARMLKEFKVDTTQWSFINEGSTGTFAIEVVTTGEKLGEIVLGENVKLNGKELTMGEGDTVSWSVPETGLSDTVGSSFVTSDATRITIARDGLQELFDAANDGKKIVFTVRGNFSSAKISATLQAETPAPTVRIDKVVSQDGSTDNINLFGGVAHVEGENLALLPGDTVKLRGKLRASGEDDDHLFDDFAYNAETGKIDLTIGDSELSFVGDRWDSDAGADVVVTSRGGAAESEPQVVTRHVTLMGV